MFCKKCGFRLDDDANFCPKCGTTVSDDIKNRVSQQTDTAEKENEACEVTENTDCNELPVVEKKPKNKKVIIISLVSGVIVFAAAIVTIVYP